LLITIYVFKDRLYIKLKQIIKSKDIKYGITDITLYILSIILVYCIAYLAGHVIDEYIVSIYIATITALLVLTVYEED
jgi:hypothetical protein